MIVDASVLACPLGLKVPTNVTARHFFLEQNSKSLAEMLLLGAYDIHAIGPSRTNCASLDVLQQLVRLPY
jgi:hypothetical protein